jgi:hypothetical protein
MSDQEDLMQGNTTQLYNSSELSPLVLKGV